MGWYCEVSVYTRLLYVGDSLPKLSRLLVLVEAPPFSLISVYYVSVCSVSVRLFLSPSTVSLPFISVSVYSVSVCCLSVCCLCLMTYSVIIGSWVLCSVFVSHCVAACLYTLLLSYRYCCRAINTKNSVYEFFRTDESYVYIVHI